MFYLIETIPTQYKIKTKKVTKINLALNFIKPDLRYFLNELRLFDLNDDFYKWFYKVNGTGYSVFLGQLSRSVPN